MKIKKKIFKAVVDSLMQNNSEYSKLHQEVGKKTEPVIRLLGQGDDDQDFKPSIKHRWFKR